MSRDELLKFRVIAVAALIAIPLGLSGTTSFAGTTATCPAAPASVPDSPAPKIPPIATEASPAPSLAGAWPSLAGLPPRCPAVPLKGSHATYNIGPGHKYTDLTSFPWLNLVAGDVVNIYYSPTPYATKFALRGSGTAAAPIVINGVADAQGRLPEITGKNAVTAKDAIAQKYFLSSGGSQIEGDGLIVIFKGYNDAYGYKPSHLTIQNLRLTGAAVGNNFTDHAGKTQTYPIFSCGIYAVTTQFLTVQNDEVFGNNLGVFVNDKDGLPGTSFFTVLRGNYVHDNGVVDDDHEHNIYVQGTRSLYEGNFIGQLVKNSVGSSLKDRSSGPVVRYNTIISAARAIDLVESESGSNTNNDPLYNVGWVYGNIVIDDFDNPGASSGNLIHWGGDSYNYPIYHNGPLYFYNNSLLINASQAQSYSLSVFDVATSQQTIHASNNIIRHTGTSMMNMCYNASSDGKTKGLIALDNTNWFGKFYPSDKCRLDRTMATLLPGEPKLTAAYRLPKGSPAIGKSVVYPPANIVFPKPASAANLQVKQQYAVGTTTPTYQPEYTARGTATDLGAFSYP